MATLVELVEDEEASKLIALSKGLKRLVEDCDFIVPDTSFVINHVLSIRYYNGINKCMSKYANEHGEINDFSLINLYKDISIDFRNSNDPNEINLDDIHDGFDQGLFILNMTLDTLTSLLLNGKIAVPSQANDELVTGYDVCLERTRIFKSIFKRMMRNGYTSKMIDENRSEAYHFAEDRKAFFREQYRNYVKYLIKNTMAGLEKLYPLTGLIKVRSCIVEDSGMFTDSDRRIIDGAMELDGRVGIASCDSHFYEKTKEVARLRKNSGLKVPRVTLMFALQDYSGYDIRNY